MSIDVYFHFSSDAEFATLAVGVNQALGGNLSSRGGRAGGSMLGMSIGFGAASSKSHKWSLHFSAAEGRVVERVNLMPVALSAALTICERFDCGGMLERADVPLVTFLRENGRTIDAGTTRSIDTDQAYTELLGRLIAHP